MMRTHDDTAAPRLDTDDARTVREAGDVGILVTDIDLGPGIAGLVLAERARALRPGLPVVFVTGRTTTLRDRPRREGEAYVPKPFDGDTLARSVRDLTSA